MSLPERKMQSQNGGLFTFLIAVIKYLKIQIHEGQMDLFWLTA